MKNKIIHGLRYGLAILIMIPIAGCAAKTATQIAGIPERPRISQHYQELLMKAGPETAKEAQKHEWSWNAVYDKLVYRLK